MDKIQADTIKALILFPFSALTFMLVWNTWITQWYHAQPVEYGMVFAASAINMLVWLLLGLVIAIITD